MYKNISKNKSKKFIVYSMLILFAVGILYSSISLWNIYHEYEKGEEEYQKIRKNFQVTRKEQKNAISEKQEENLSKQENSADNLLQKGDSVISQQAEGEEKEAAILKIDIKKLQESYQGIVAWISIEGTAIDYPVMQGKDNVVYLTKTTDGSTNRAGSIFLDYRNSGDFTNRNSVIYGHRMKNGSMFGTLDRYEKKSFFEEHSFITLYLPDETRTYEIFSAYRTKAGKTGYQKTFDSDSAYHEFLKEIQMNSIYETGIDISAEDHIITLSTCTTGEKEERFVVHAKQI